MRAWRAILCAFLLSPAAVWSQATTNEFYTWAALPGQTVYKFQTVRIDAPFTLLPDSSGVLHLGTQGINFGPDFVAITSPGAPEQVAINSAFVTYRVAPPTGPGPAPVGTGAWASDGAYFYIAVPAPSLVFGTAWVTVPARVLRAPPAVSLLAPVGAMQISLSGFSPGGTILAADSCILDGVTVTAALSTAANATGGALLNLLAPFTASTFAAVGDQCVAAQVSGSGWFVPGSGLFTPVEVGAIDAVGGTTVSAARMNPGGTLLAGDSFNLDGQMYVLSASGTASAAGTATLALTTPLLAADAVGDVIYPLTAPPHPFVWARAPLQTTWAPGQ